MSTNGVASTLVAFAGTNGSKPYGGLVQGKDGSFYGTTVAGGPIGSGSVYKVTPGGTLTPLFFFGSDPLGHHGIKYAAPEVDVAALRGFKDGVVYLHMQGACSGCPSSTATLKMGIENLLKHYVPEVVEVQAAQ